MTPLGHPAPQGHQGQATENIEVGDLIGWQHPDSRLKQFGVVLHIGIHHDVGTEDALWCLWGASEKEAVRLFHDNEWQNSSDTLPPGAAFISVAGRTSEEILVTLIKKKVIGKSKQDRFDTIIEEL